MKELSCRMCGRAMGEIEKGKIRNGYAVLCSGCWGRADAAVQMAEMALKGAPGKHASTPEFLKDLFGGFGKKNS